MVYAQPMSLTVTRTPLEGRAGERLRLERGGRPLSHRQLHAALVHEPSAGYHLNAAIAAAPWPAVFWESAPVTVATVDRPYEAVLIQSKALARVRPNPRPFRAHLAAHEGRPEVVTFASLGGDATLIAPAQDGDIANYTHLAAFARGAPRAQRRSLWRAVGVAAQRWLMGGSGPMWLSTSGLGVYWLHVRLDSRPKYYTWDPFRAPPG